MSNNSWEEHTEALTNIMLRLQRKLRAVTEERDRLLKERDSLIKEHEMLLIKLPLQTHLSDCGYPRTNPNSFTQIYHRVSYTLSLQISPLAVQRVLRRLHSTQVSISPARSRNQCVASGAQMRGFKG